MIFDSESFKSPADDTFKFMENANRKAELWTRILMKYVAIVWIPSGLSLNIASLIISIIRFGHIDVDILYVPYKYVYVAQMQYANDK